MRHRARVREKKTGRSRFGAEKVSAGIVMTRRFQCVARYSRSAREISWR